MCIRDRYQTAKGKLVIFTALLLGAAWIIEYLAPEIGKWAFVAACLIGVAPVAQRAFSALRMGQPFTIESLMTIAAIGALFINAAEEAALVVFLFAVGEGLEGVAAGKARDGIRALANLVPKTAQLVTGDTTREVPAASLTIGQTVLVRPGDRIPADGEILDGTSGVDASPVTGERVPQTRGPGGSPYADPNAMSSALVQILAASSLALVVYVATRPGELQRLTPGAFTAFMTAMLAILPSLKRLTSAQALIQRGLAAVFALDSQPAQKPSMVRPSVMAGNCDPGVGTQGAAGAGVRLIGSAAGFAFAAGVGARRGQRLSPGPVPSQGGVPCDRKRQPRGGRGGCARAAWRACEVGASRGEARVLGRVGERGQGRATTGLLLVCRPARRRAHLTEGAGRHDAVAVDGDGVDGRSAAARMDGASVEDQRVRGECHDDLTSKAIGRVTPRYAPVVAAPNSSHSPVISMVAGPGGPDFPAVARVLGVHGARELNR